MKYMKFLKRFSVWTVCTAAALAVVMAAGSCATRKADGLKRSGIKGTVIPVDSEGEEIELQERDRIIVNCVPVRSGVPVQDRSITVNTRRDGSFSVDLREGEYLIEFFLQGFYVRSMRLELSGSRKTNLGDIHLERIGTESGLPIRGDTVEESAGSGGDVNIQPPVN
jgi:hypothetical protein